MHQDANHPAEALFATTVKSLRGRDVLSLIVPDHREVFEPVMQRMRELRHAQEKRAAARRAARVQARVAAKHVAVPAAPDSSSSEDGRDVRGGGATRSPSQEAKGEAVSSPGVGAYGPEVDPAHTDQHAESSTSEMQIDITTLDGRTVTVDVAVGLADQVL